MTRLISRLPSPTLFSPGTGEPALRWGLIGPGWIAGEFVAAAHAHTRQRFVAVASRAVERATAFGALHGVSGAHGSAAALVARPDVDVVYIATPQSEHLELGLQAIAAGKHVLIEKPIALTADDARQLADAARVAGVFLMEAMWSRYLPQTSVIRSLLADGALGEIATVHADHGQAIPADPTHRLYRPELGGGALLDLGIYPVQFDSMVRGAPTDVVAVGGTTDTGVDAHATLVLGHRDGAPSTLTTSMLTRTPSTAVIAGSAARLELGPFFFGPTSFAVHASRPGDEPLHWDDPTEVTGFGALSWEATALASFVGEGRSESPLHTLDETVSVLTTLDDVRAQIAAAVLPA